MTARRPINRPSFRQQLLIGASATSLVTGVPLAAQSYIRAPRNPAEQAAQAAATRATQNQAASTATRRTIEAFQRASVARQRMDAAQTAARAAAQAAQASIPNGLGAGGLQVAGGAASNPSLWIGGKGPVQSAGTNGRTDVTVDQTQAQAILNWDSFNVGRETDLTFDQHGNTSWVALNRVTDASADPSHILGTIKADGTVLILNRNGVIFGGTSQVNTRNLVAAATNVTNEQFLTQGVYSARDGNDYLPSFTTAGGQIKVEVGAQLSTAAPKTVLEGGGYVLLMGTSVENAGTITTLKGQTLLAAGDDFVVRPGVGTDANQFSTTRGNEVRGIVNDGSTSGAVTNTGLITAQQGDITLTGRTVTQGGVALATTSVNQRGTIHLSTSLSDADGLVTLAPNSLTAILPELDSADTALNTQKDALVAASTKGITQPLGQFDNLSVLADRRDQSRVEIVSGGDVLFDSGSTTLAQGGQVSALVANRIQTEAGAIIDVSGVRGVALDVGSNAIKVNIQPNELRDSPVNRDTGLLNNQDIWVDARDLILVPAGTGGYATDRYYTGGGLIEVGGYLGNTPHGIGEWAAVGGAITLSAADVVAKQGSVFNVAGGSLDYTGGSVLSTRLQGVDGKLYDINDAPANMQFVSVGMSQTVAHARWGAQYAEVYSNPLFNRGIYVRHEDSYSVGRDAGQLVLSAPGVSFDGEIVADIVTGARQNQARPAGLIDGYKATQNTAALAGGLQIADIRLGVAPLTSDIVFGNGAPTDDAAAAIRLNADLVNGFGLGRLSVVTTGDVRVENDLALADGGRFDLLGGSVDLAADLTARSGAVTVTAVAAGGITVDAGTMIDTRGLWTNAALDPADLSGIAFVNGGNVTLQATEDVVLSKGASIDASSGAALLATGSLVGGIGGDIALTASSVGTGLSVTFPATGRGSVILDGEVAASGVTRGGRLSIQSANIVAIADHPLFADGTLPTGTIAPFDLRLGADYVIPAGTPLPFAASSIISFVAAGQPLPVEVTSVGNQSTCAGCLVTAAPWTLPTDAQGPFYTFPDAAKAYQPGDTIPAGKTIYAGVGKLPAGYIVPADVFPNGISIPPVVNAFTAGTILPDDLTLVRGTVIPKGSTLEQPAAIEPILNLDPALFGDGFSAYTINGQERLIVASGTKINAVEPVYRLTHAGYTTPTGADPADALEVWTPPTYLDDPVNATLTRRSGVDVTLLSGINPELVNLATGGSIDIGEGSLIEVDPGHSVKIASGGQVTVDGTISAPGGTISIVNNRSLGGQGSGGPRPTYDPGSLSVWIGDHAVLDASARAFTAYDRQGAAYADVVNGGSITLGSEGGLNPIYSYSQATDAFLIVRPGAVLDVSGTSARIDPDAGLAIGPGAHRRDPLEVASSGGSITLRSYSGMYLDGDFKGASGGVGASGGTLSLVLEAPVYNAAAVFAVGTPSFNNADIVVPTSLRSGRVLTIGGEYQPSGLKPDLIPGEADSGFVTGQARISAAQIEAGGFDTLSLWGRNGIAFDGNVTLDVGRSISLLQGGLYDAVENANVTLNAPYILYSGLTRYSSVNAEIVPTLTTVFANGGDFVANANLIDFRNTGTIGFDDTHLNSRTDIRFLVGADPGNASAITSLSAAGNLFFTAQQLYPTTNAVAQVTAGLTQDENNRPIYRPGNVISIASIDGVDPGAPLSAFGVLSFTSEIVRQGGIVRAPLGSITLGAPDFNTSILSASQIELLHGSITSVSAAGLVIPYGGTADGVAYTVNGQAPLAPDVITGTYTSRGTIVQQGIQLAGTNIVSDPGSVLDLSGGGTLAGAAFLQGRGGSVDTLLNPITSGGTVYAIVPGIHTAPPVGGTAAAWTGATPDIGQQVTIPDGVPGLPAGTYTLLPANYALMPGGYRVELGGRTLRTLDRTIALPNGFYAMDGVQSIADTTIRDPLETLLTITPGATARTYSQYNEQGYGAFLTAQAATFGKTRPLLPVDGKTLFLKLDQLAEGETSAAPSIIFQGSASFAGSDGGYDGTLVLGGNNTGNLVITGPDSTTLRTDRLTTVAASTIDAIGAQNLYIGGAPTLQYGGAPIVQFFGPVLSVRLEDGAILRGSQIILDAGNITLDPGAQINTLGRNVSAPDSSTGYLFGSEALATAMLVASNGQITLNPASQPSGAVNIGKGASIYSEQSIGFLGAVNFDGTPRLGTRNLALSVSAINLGEAKGLAAASAAGTLPAGINFDQGFLDRLLTGDPTMGAPAVETLTLSAAKSFNIFGSVDLNTIDPVTGKSRLEQLVLNTPAIYGSGGAGDEATITTGMLIWNGLRAGTNPETFASAQPGVVLAGGAGTGQGTLNLVANTIVFGYAGDTQSQSQTGLDRLTLGFSTVNLTASNRITANNRGSLSVYQNGIDAASYEGGTLNLTTPLLTGEVGSVMAFTTGGALTVRAPASGMADTAAIMALGGEVRLNGNSVLLDTAVALPSGKLVVTANGDISLTDRVQIDLAGRQVSFFDQRRYSWGGDVELESTVGSVLQSAGSTIDISAANADAGTIKATAIHGTVDFAGSISGDGGADHDDGAIDIRAGTLADFAGLNTRLNAGDVFGARAFVIKTGDLVIGDEVRANDVSISVDGGSLTVNGTIDASGTAVGSIALAARDNLTLTSAAVLDTHGTTLRTDSYGAAIEAPNTAHVALTTALGTVTLAPGATIDLRAADQIARGKLEISAPRVGDDDIAIDVGGAVDIRGAASVAVSGFRGYSPADGVINQSLLDDIDDDSSAFIDAASRNAALQGRLAGLEAYGDLFHLRPGVEIRSATPTGDLTVDGDIDLSGYRYGRGVDPAVYGSGEAGVLTIRAGGDLTIKGSISDGFAHPAATPDDKGWGINLPTEPQSDFTIPVDGVVLADQSAFLAQGSLNFAFQVADFTGLQPGSTIPVEVPVLNASFAPGTKLTAPIYDASGAVLYPAGTVLTEQVDLFNGERLGAGFAIPQDTYVYIASTPWPAGATLSVFRDYVATAGDTPLAAGSILPAGSGVQYVGSSFVPTRPTGADGTQGRIYAIAPMLAPGSQSWSMQLVSGGDLGSANSRTLAPVSSLEGGDMVLSDAHFGGVAQNLPIFSVIRTGTGDLDLLAGGNFSQKSLYGIYTAGTQTELANGNQGFNIVPAPFNDGSGTILGFGNEAYESLLNPVSYYPDHGGDVLIAAQRDLSGSIKQVGDGSATVGSWLLRQGGLELGEKAAWAINFGAYRPTYDDITGTYVTTVAGFTGIGALAGGNVTVRAGGNAGNLDLGQVETLNGSQSSTGLVVAVGGSGRVTSVTQSGSIVTGGTLVQTGGGDLKIDIGGQLNPNTPANLSTDLSGTFTDIRGSLTLDAGTVGATILRYGSSDANDPRAVDPMAATAAILRGGPVVLPGDGTVNITTRGDLTLGGAGDPGMISQPYQTAIVLPDTTGAVRSFFGLWQQQTAITLFSAGGNIAPINAGPSNNVLIGQPGDGSVQAIVPSQFAVIAPTGNIYTGSFELVPSVLGQLDLLAGGSVYGSLGDLPSQARIDISGAASNLNAIPNPFKPYFELQEGFETSSNGLTGKSGGLQDGYFAFEDDTVTNDLHAGDADPIRLYANQDIVGIQVGGQRTFNFDQLIVLNLAAKAVEVRAGRDIVGFGGLGGSLFQNIDLTDISIISAGRDIFYSNARVAGPGLLDVSAGRNLFQGGRGILESVGRLYGASGGNNGDGAGIAVTVGTGAQGADYADFAKLYFDPANQLTAGSPLADSGKVAKTYDQELYAWLKERFGFEGTSKDALATFLALPPEQQGIFVRQVYYLELALGGREFNNPDSPRFGSYLRGRDAIAVLFPEKDASGNALTYDGDLTMFSESGGRDSRIVTDFGGDVQILTPGGQTIVGVEGIVPGKSAGLLTQGSGNIQVYSKDSILLGLSRVFTTFGGNITMWSAEGDINAGRGAKGTVVFAPARRVYDEIGNVALSPTAPTSGAGIGTLNPIPEVPPGDIDLIAPLGTIDAGEAGIRVSGNVNLAALRVVNAANIQVQGDATGIPVTAAVNTGALTAASAANAAVVNEAARLAERARPKLRTEIPSIITGRLLGFGENETRSRF